MLKTSIESKIDVDASDSVVVFKSGSDGKLEIHMPTMETTTAPGDNAMLVAALFCDNEEARGIRQRLAVMHYEYPAFQAKTVPTRAVVRNVKGGE